MVFVLLDDSLPYLYSHFIFTLSTVRPCQISVRFTVWQDLQGQDDGLSCKNLNETFFRFRKVVCKFKAPNNQRNASEKIR